MGNLFYKIVESIGFTHPVHPLIVHVTIGTIVASLLFAILAEIYKKPLFYDIARYNANLTLVAAVITTFFGFMDWQYHYNGAGTSAIKIKIVVSFVLIARRVVTVLVNRQKKEGSKLPLILYIANIICAGVLGYYGGALVY